MRWSIATSEPAARVPQPLRAGLGRAGSRACGSSIEVRLLLEGADDAIAELSVVTRGHSLPGDAAALVTLFVGMSASQALEVTHQEIAVRLGGLPESKMYCCVLLHEALCSALADARRLPSAQARRPCVTCRCFTVAEDLIRRTVERNGLTSLEQVARYTRAGAGCGLCADGISSILSSVIGDTESGRGRCATTCVAATAAAPANDE